MIVTEDSTVNPSSNGLRSRSKVPFSYHNMGTYRFGEYSPHFCMEVVNNDKVPFQSIHDVRTYTMKSPVLGNVKYMKDYFMVPNEAILPFNWDKIYTNPLLGDDVDVDAVNCLLRFNTDDWFRFLDSLIHDYINQPNRTLGMRADRIFKTLIFLERFYSAGSLFETLGCHIHSNFYYSGEGHLFDSSAPEKGFDEFFDTVVRDLIQNYPDDSVEVFLFDGTDVPSPYTLVFRGERTAGSINMRQFLEMIRDNNDWYFAEDFDYNIPFLTSNSRLYVRYSTDRSFSINMSRVLAYQIVCAHFYTNDKVDYIYSAELYRQNIHSLELDLRRQGFTFNTDFQYNGVSTPFDYLSGNYLNGVLLQFRYQAESGDFSFVNRFFDFWRLILGFNRSLRHLDYFSGSKTRPLAVGDVNVSVVGNRVNAIDITRNIQRQRFFNYVNRVGRKFEEYVKAFGGADVKPDYHNPLYLAHTSDSMHNIENENTGSDQFTAASSVSSVMRSNASKFAFEALVDRPCIIIGISYFDLSRVYADIVERQNLHKDRFDMFNEYLQYIGDQPIYNVEQCANSITPLNNFGYALRHLEYKTRVDQCFGGFSTFQLPGWAYLADKDRYSYAQRHIGPDYIRSKSYEFDEFYVSLTGYSLGTYWHFIIDNNNVTEPVRPMSYAPQIL